MFFAFLDISLICGLKIFEDYQVLADNAVIILIALQNFVLDYLKIISYKKC